MEKHYLKEIFVFFVMGTITLRLFLIGANLHIWKNMPEPRAWGVESPSSLPGTKNPQSGFRVTQANLAFYLRSQIKGIIRDVSLLKKFFRNIDFKRFPPQTSRIIIEVLYWRQPLQQ